MANDEFEVFDPSASVDTETFNPNDIETFNPNDVETFTPEKAPEPGFIDKAIGVAKGIAALPGEIWKRKSIAPTMMPADMVETLSKKYNVEPELVRSYVIMMGGTADLVRSNEGKPDSQQSIDESYTKAADIMSEAEQEGGLNKLIKSPMYQAMLFMNSPEIRDVLDKLPEHGIGAVSNLSMMLPMLLAKQASDPSKRALLDDIQTFVDKDFALTRGLAQLALPIGVGSKVATGVGATGIAATKSILPKLGASVKAAEAVAPWVGKGLTYSAISAQTGIMGAAFAGLAAKKGETIDDATQGFIVGAALPIVGSLLGKGTAKLIGGTLDTMNAVAQRRLLNISDEVIKRQEVARNSYDTIYEYFRHGVMPEDQKTLEGLAKSLGIDNSQITKTIKALEGPDFSRKMVKAPAYRIEAIQTILRTKSNALFDEFANTYLKNFTSLKSSGVDMMSLLKSFRSTDEFRNAMNVYTFIPEKVRTGALSMLDSTGKLPKGIRVVTDWISRIGADQRDTVLNSRFAINDYINKVISHTGKDKDYAKTLWDGFITGKLTQEVLERRGYAAVGRATTLGEKVVAGLAPTQYRIDQMERLYGMEDLSLAHMRVNNRIAQADAKYQELLGRVHEDFGQDFQATVDKFGDRWDEEFFYYLHENPEMAAKGANRLEIDNEVLAAMQEQSAKLTTVQQGLREDLRNLGFIVDERKGYIQHKIVTPAKAVLRIEQALDDQALLGTGRSVRSWLEDPSAHKAFTKNFKGWMDSNARFRDLIYSIERISHQDIKDLDTLTSAMSAMYDMNGTINRMSPIVSAAYERSNTKPMPMLIREMNPLKTIDGYLRSTFRAAYLKNEITTFQKYLPILEKMAKGSAKLGLGKANRAQMDYDFMREYLNLAMGYNANLVSSGATEKVLAKARKEAAKYGVDSRNVDAIFTRSNNAARTMTNIMYTSMMINPRTVLRNMEASWTMTAAEIGLPEAANWASQAYLEMALHPQLVYGAERKAMLKAGKLTERHFGESLETVKHGGTLVQRIRSIPEILREGGGWDAAAHASGIMAEIGLSLFGLSENVIRVNSVLVGKKWAKYIGEQASHTDVNKALGSVQSKGIRTEMAKLGNDIVALKALEREATDIGKKAQYRKDIAKLNESLEDIAGDYLLQRTQFVYTELNKAKFMRDIHPLLSMFTRWPTEIPSRLINRALAGNARKGVEELMTPFYTLALAGWAIKKASENNERAEALAEVYPGRQEFATHAPITNFTSYNVVKNPPLILQPAIKAWQAATGSESAFTALAQWGLRTFNPLVPLTEFIYDDVWTRMIQGKAGDSPFKEGMKYWIEDNMVPAYQIIKDTATDAIDAVLSLPDQWMSYIPPDESDKIKLAEMPESMKGWGLAEGIKRDVKGVVNPLINLGGHLLEATGTRAEFVDEPELYHGMPSMAGLPSKLIKAGKAIKYGETGAIAAKNWLRSLPADAKGIATLSVNDGKLLVNGKVVGAFESSEMAKSVALQWENTFRELGQKFERLWK